LRRSRGRRDFLFAIVGARLAGPAARLGLRLLLFRLSCSDCRRQDTERNPLFAFLLDLRSILSRSAIRTEIAAVATLEAVAASFPAPVATLALILALAGFDFALVFARFAFGHHLFIAVHIDAIVVVIPAGTAMSLLLLVARAIFLQHAEIMVGILEVIFGLDTIAAQLRITRERLVFLKQLRRITALPVVLPVAGTAGHALGALSTATTTTAALTIIDQLVVSLSHWRRQSRCRNSSFLGSVVPPWADRPAQ
jgi:hypothetical protein